MGTLWGKGAVGVEVGTKNYDPIFKVGVLLAPGDRTEGSYRYPLCPLLRQPALQTAESTDQTDQECLQEASEGA